MPSRSRLSPLTAAKNRRARSMGAAAEPAAAPAAAGSAQRRSPRLSPRRSPQAVARVPSPVAQALAARRTTTTSKKAKKSGSGRGKAWSAADQRQFLDIMENELPFGALEWDAVASEFNGKC